MERPGHAGTLSVRSLHVLLRSHAWLALGAGVQVLFTAALVPFVELPWAVPLCAALGTFSAYGSMRLMKVGDAASGSEHLSWFQRHRAPMMWLCVLSGVMAAVLLLLFVPGAISLTLVLLPAVALYILPNRTGRHRGLRYVPFLKLFLIAAVWSGVVVAFPFMARGALQHPLFLPLLLERALFVFAITLPFDIRDLHIDPHGERTLPRAIGERFSRFIALLALTASLVVLLLVCATQGMMSGFLGACVGHAVTAVLVLRSRPGHDELHYAFLLDGTLVLVPCCFLLGSML